MKKTKTKKKKRNYLDKVPITRRTHGNPSFIKSKLVSSIIAASKSVNDSLVKIKRVITADFGAGILESKTICALVHDLFVGSICQLGFSPGSKSGKPDLLYYPLDQPGIHYWIEVKGSSNGRQDYQSHPTKNQIPPPKNGIHILFNVEVKDYFRIKEAYLLSGAEYKKGSGVNSPYLRITKESLARKELIFTA